MRIRVKEIRKAHKRKEKRYKALHKQEATPAPAARGAAKPAGGARASKPAGRSQTA